MKAVLITGHRGLVGSAIANHLNELGYYVVGIDCDIRSQLFPELAPLGDSKIRENYSNVESHFCDIRDDEKVREIINKVIKTHHLCAIIHTAAQPSHDWAKQNPLEDFSLNATATLKMLMLAQELVPESLFIHFSTNKVYGDNPNTLPVIEMETRYELSKTHEYYEGINEMMPIDHCKHSLFGASKLSADIYVQEYGRYYSMKTIVLRGGCLTGPNHRGTELHGFMNYLIKCAVMGTQYTIFGYEGKQVRDNLSSEDIAYLVELILNATEQLNYPIVANLGGGRENSISILELVQKLKHDHGLVLKYTISDTPRIGDHIWYITSNKVLENTFNWRPRVNIDNIIENTVSHFKVAHI